MARVTHVKAAQARYATIPVMDPYTGHQKVTPVMRANGTQKVTKTGKPVVVRVTQADKSQPKPNRKCGKCGVEITVGSPYKWIKPKSGPYGGHLMVRCEACPTWQVWDYSSSMSAQLAQIAYELPSTDDANSPDDVEQILADAAQAVRDIADQKQESADNIEEGFGHTTYQSEELADIASSLNDWADEIEGADVPELPEPEATECPECQGAGEIENPDWADDTDDDVDEYLPCDDCEGTGEVVGDDPTDEQMDEWRSECQDVLGIVDDCPV